MADKSAIEWCDATWNPVVGCSPVSEGCEHCWAARLASGRLKNHPLYKGLAEGGRWKGEIRQASDEEFTRPLHWRKPRTVFVCPHGDLFHEKVPFDWIADVLAIMGNDRCDAHTFLLLTKRPARALEFSKWYRGRCGRPYGGRPYATPLKLLSRAPNIWLGATAENQPRADERIPELLNIDWPGKRFVSLEPMLGPVDFNKMPLDFPPCSSECEQWPSPCGGNRKWQCSNRHRLNGLSLDWLILGGESGPGARPMHPEWPRRVRDDCVQAGVPFFFKQWGEYRPIRRVYDNEDDHGDPERQIQLENTGAVAVDEERVFYQPNPGLNPYVMERVGKARAGRLLDGRTWDERPQP